MRTLAASLALSLFLTACTDRPPLEPLAATAVGTYTLKTVDGSALPFTYLEAPGWRDEIISGRVELYGDGRFRDESLYRRTRNGVATPSTVAVVGRWARRDDVISFLPSGGDGPGRHYTMRLEGSRLTLIEVGLTSVFER